MYPLWYCLFPQGPSLFDQLFQLISRWARVRTRFRLPARPTLSLGRTLGTHRWEWTCPEDWLHEIWGGSSKLTCWKKERTKPVKLGKMRNRKYLENENCTKGIRRARRWEKGKFNQKNGDFLDGKKTFSWDRPINGVIFIPKLFQTLKSAWRTRDKMT